MRNFLKQLGLWLLLSLLFICTPSQLSEVAYATASSSFDLESPLPDFVQPTAPYLKDFNKDNQTATSQPQIGKLNNSTDEQLLNFGPALILDIIFGIFSSVAVVIGLLSGLRILFAGGDPKKVQTGIMGLVYAVLGMVIIGGAWIIVRLVLEINLVG